MPSRFSFVLAALLAPARLMAVVAWEAVVEASAGLASSYYPYFLAG